MKGKIYIDQDLYSCPRLDEEVWFDQQQEDQKEKHYVHCPSFIWNGPEGEKSVEKIN